MSTHMHPHNKDPLTIYKPNGDADDSSGLDESENDSTTSDTSVNNNNTQAPITPIRHGPSRRQMDEVRPEGRQELSNRDVDLLTLVTTAADKTDSRDQGALDFANLSLALDSFFQANQLTPKNYASYDLCIYVIMLLCNYDLPSWRSRLEAFINDYGRKNYSARTEKHLRLKKLEETRYSRALLTQYLKFWVAKSQYVQTRTQDMSKVALSLDQKSLLRETMRFWITEFERRETEINRAEAFYDCKLAVKTIRLLKKKTLKAQHDDTLLERHRLQHAFQKWKLLTAKVADHYDLSMELYNRNVARRHFLDWLYNTYEVKTARAYDTKLMKIRLYDWMNQHDRVIDLCKDSEEVYVAFSAGKLFDHWIKRTGDILTDKSLADKLYNGQRLKHHMDLWKFRTDMQIKFNVVQGICHRQVKLEWFNTWQHKTQLLLESTNFRQTMLLRSVMKKWTTGYRHRKAETRIKNQILHQNMCRWILLERSVLYDTYRKQELQRLVFRHWLKRTVKSYHREKKKALIATKLYNHNLLKKVLYHWYEWHTFQKKNEMLSILIRTKKLVENPLNKMLTVTRSTRELELKAVEMEKTHLLTSVMITWQLKALSSVTMRLALSKAKFEQMNGEKIKLQFFTIWKYKHEAVETSKDVAVLVDGKLFINHMKSIIQSWNEKTNSITRQQKLAEEYCTESVMQVSMVKWKDKLNTARKLEEEGEFLDDCRILKAQERLFRVWSTQAFKLISQVRNADEFFERRQKTRFRKLWKHWRATTAEKKYSHKSANDAIAPSASAAVPQPTPTRNSYADILRRRGAESVPLSLLRQTYLEKTAGLDNPENSPDGGGLTSAILETPSRVRFKTSVPATTVQRWIRNKSGRASFSGGSRLTPRASQLDLTMDFLQNQITPPRR